MKISRTLYTPMLMGLCLVVFSGCVDQPDPVRTDAGTAGDGAAADLDGGATDADAWSAAADGGEQPARVECGSAICMPPPFTSGFIAACCADEATSTCGLAMSGGSCPKPAVGDPRCPALNWRGIVVAPSCCTERGQCGLNAFMYGIPACIELAAASVTAKLTGFGGEFPKPRACEVGEAIDEDGGV